MKRVLAIFLSLLLAFSMIGCSDQSNTAQNADAQGNSNATAVSSDDTAGNADPWNVAVFTMSGSGEFWASVMAGAERACEEFGLVYTIDGPATETSYEQQIAMVEDAITKGADAICIAVCDSEALVPTLEAAAAKGIKIILFNTTCNYDGLTFIATDNYEAGRLGGKALGEALGGEGKVCLLGSQETVPSNVARCEGARDYIEENFPNMEVVDIQYCDGDMEKALTISNDWITAIPDLKGIFSNNDFSTIAAANIIEERGRVGEIMHVGFDATETNVVYLESGTTAVDIIEIGTPFAYYNDISVIQEFKDLYPKAKILADYKILDGGEFMSALAFRAGADIVTVSVSANNETIAGAIKTARAYGREVLVDTMGVPLERIPERAAVAQALGADYICVHTSLDVPDAPDPLESMRLARQGAPELKLAVAGGINLQTLPRIIAAKPDLIIVGGAICKAVDPIETAKTMKKMILEEAIQ